MKKFLKILCLIPLLLLTLGIFFGCNEKKVENFELSISEEYAIYEGGSAGYVIEKSSTPIKINAVIRPTDFALSNVVWQSSATNVARVNDGILTCVGDGRTVISARYKDSSNDVEARIIVTVTKQNLPKFSSANVNVEYQGTDIKGDYKVLNEMDGEFRYFYYDLNSNGRQVDEIKNVGKYLITYSKILEDRNVEYAKMIVNVNKAIIQFSAKNGESFYGDPLQNGFYNVNDTQIDFSNGIDLIAGVGEDSDKILGKYVYTTECNNKTSAGEYQNISIKVSFYSEFEKNYEVSITKGMYTVKARQVVLAIGATEISYGDSIILNKISFDLYDYQDYVESDNSIIDIEKLNSDFKKIITLNKYTIKKDGVVAQNNDYGYIDVGEYRLTFEPSSNSNLEFKTILEGDLKINKKSVTVTPESLSKTYGTPDPETINYKATDILNSNEIRPFLHIDYSGLDTLELGEKNIKASVGSYYYYIDNTANSNYNFSLSDNALESWGNEDTKIVFKITPCNINFEFENYTGYYTNPKSSYNSIHTASYYADSSCDYVLKLKSYTVNGVEKINDEVISCVDPNFANNGNFVLETGEKFKILLVLSAVNNKDGYYARYSVFFDSIVIENGRAQNLNCTIVNSSYINLNKEIVEVKPNTTQNSMTYNPTTEGETTRNNFLKNYTLSTNFTEPIGDIVEDIGKVLSFKDKFGKYVKLQGETETQVNSIGSVGTYKIFLSNDIKFKEGKEYVDFVLNGNYYFTINPYEVNIVVEQDQNKIYGADDPQIRCAPDENTPLFESDNTKSGNLSRVAGENVGTYKVTLGSLSYGSNYSLKIKEETTFEITRRSVVVTPNPYNVTYGDAEPSTIAYDLEIVGKYNANLLTMPVFGGAFEIKNGEQTISKVGNSYPVTYKDGKVVEYTIKRGNFALTADSAKNYDVTINETSIFKVNPKELTINLVANFHNAGSGELSKDLSAEDPSLVNGDNMTIVANTLTKNSETDKNYYYIGQLSDLNITIKNGTTDVTDCYSLILGQNIAYYIDSIKISFKIVSASDDKINTLSQTYTANPIDNTLFVLQPENGYTLDSSSIYSFVYKDSFGNVVENPRDVGNYTVSISLDGEGSQLVLKNGDTNINLTKFNEQQNDYIAILSQLGYLNITKATISANTDLLGFEGSLIYGSTKDDLPEIKLIDGENKIFVGVNNEEIKLKKFNTRSYEYVSSSSSIESLPAGQTNITIRVQAVLDDGTINKNYSPLTIDVPLIVAPKPIVIVGEPNFELDGGVDKIVYNGGVKRFVLNMQTEDSQFNYSISYNYYKLDVVYENSAVGKVKKYVKNVDAIEYSETIALEDLIKNINSISIEGNYVVVKYNDESSAYFKYQLSDTPTNAGIYLCIATCKANTNYVLQSGTEKENSFSFKKFFEIEKSSNITIVDWKKDFYYGTAFSKKNLPFEFDISPSSLKSEVTYQTEDWTSEYLAVGSYTVNIVIDVDNYYYLKTESFNVCSCKAEIVFPVGDNKYIYNNGTPITSFLNPIYANLYNNENVLVAKVLYADVNEINNFSFEFFDEANEKLDNAPGDVGSYYVKAIYRSESNNYFGEGIYYYQIAKKAYEGTVQASNKTIVYNPNYTASGLYNVLLGMFSCDLEATAYTLTIANNTNDNEIYTPDDEKWVSNINRCSSIHTIKFTVNFKDDTIADRVLTADLTVNKFKITDSMIAPVSSAIVYNYNGYPVYKELSFTQSSEMQTVTLIPKSILIEEKESVDGGNYYIKYLGYSETDKDFKVSLYDKLENLMFTLSYKYYVGGVVSTSIPVTPNDTEYKVVYSLSAGENYVSSISLSDSTFKISKIENVFIKLKSSYSVQYTGNDMTGIIGENYVVKDSDIIVTDNGIESDSNLNYTVLRDVSGTISYSASKGIFLIVRYKNGDDYVGNGLTEVGNYTLIVSLVATSTYNPSLYFNNINFSNSDGPWTKISTSNLEKYSDTSYIYKTYVSCSFEITKAEMKYDLTNLKDLLTFSSDSEADCSIDLEKNCLVIQSNSSFSIKYEGFVIEIYKKNTASTLYEFVGYSFANIEEEQEGIEYYLIIKNNNYNDSGYIRVIKMPSTTS